MSQSSNYAFYDKPENFDGLMLGQHVLIEIDNGKDTSINKTGIWLYSDFTITETPCMISLLFCSLNLPFIL